MLYEYGAHKPQDFAMAARLYKAGCEKAVRGAWNADGERRRWVCGLPNARAALRARDPAAHSPSFPPFPLPAFLPPPPPLHSPPPPPQLAADSCYHLGLLHAYGRGTEQDHPLALSIFQACHDAHAHAGCALYLGLMRASGQGADVDYEAARVYLQKAAESGDVRYLSKAHEAYAALDRLIDEAEKGTRRTLEALAAGLAARPSDEQLGGRRRSPQRREEEEEEGGQERAKQAGGPARGTAVEAVRRGGLPRWEEGEEEGEGEGAGGGRDFDGEL